MGDAINPLIFEHFLGDEVLDGNPSSRLLGIGSILGLKSHPGCQKIVLSSGWADDEATYGAKPNIDGNYDIRAVRGPLTARALSLPDELAVIDGAYLIADVLKRSKPAVKGVIGFIPHHKSLDFYPDWESIAEAAGFVLLDVRLEPSEFMEALWSCEYVVTEAMHGAILADAYRIPWVPIRLYGHINEFKWLDWAASLKLDLEIDVAPSKLHSAQSFSGIINRRGVPKGLSSVAARGLLWWRKRVVKRWLRGLKQRQGQLSDSRLLELAVCELRGRCMQVRADYL